MLLELFLLDFDKLGELLMKSISCIPGKFLWFDQWRSTTVDHMSDAIFNINSRQSVINVNAVQVDSSVKCVGSEINHTISVNVFSNFSL